MRAELFRPDEPERVVAVATWSGGRSSLEVFDTSVQGLERFLRPTPVVVPGGPAPRSSQGETLEIPGSLEWFRAALTSRSEALGLAVRFVAADLRNGWDPAANYRRFEDQQRRLISAADATPS